MFHLVRFDNNPSNSYYFYLLDDETMECNDGYAFTPSEALDAMLTTYSYDSMVDQVARGIYQDLDGYLVCSFNERPADLSIETYPELYL